MAKHRENDRSALDAEAIKMLKTDPEKYFESIRRQPFGFVPPNAKHGEKN